MIEDFIYWKTTDLRCGWSIVSHCKKMTTEYKTIKVKQVKLIQPEPESGKINTEMGTQKARSQKKVVLSLTKRSDLSICAPGKS